jgi:uncharacterized protein
MDMTGYKKKLFFYLLTLSTALFSTTVYSEQAYKPTISILIDDLGYKFKEDTRALALPGPVAYAILPHGPHTETMSKLAYKKGKDILLHLPMQAEVMDKNEFLGPGALTLNMTREEFFKTLNINIQAVPNLIGINNHMGSLLTQHPGHMQWLMDSMKANGQFYVDSLTSDNSVAARLAKENNVPYLTRDVFLDHKQGPKYVRKQFKELIRVAKLKGSALGIGHPHTGTIQVLSEVLQNVERYGVKFVSIKSLIKKPTAGKRYAQSTGAASAGM